MTKHREPERDPRLAHALRLVDAGRSDEELESLRRRVMAAARDQLAVLTAARQPWWAWAAGWGRVAVPIGLAASLAAGVVLAGSSLSELTAAAEVESESSLVLREVTLASGADLVTSQLALPSTQDALLDAAITR
jgi:hypothetical protein